MQLTNKYSSTGAFSPADYDDRWRYYDVSLRVFPVTNGIQLYSGTDFSMPVPGIVMEYPRVVEQQLIHVDVFFRWTGGGQKDVDELFFNVGLYAHEVERTKNWDKLSRPVGSVVVKSKRIKKTKKKAPEKTIP
jgi:hypothetical protein